MAPKAASDTETPDASPSFREAQTAQYLTAGDEAYREVEGRWRTYRRKGAQVADAARAALPQADDAAVEVGCGGGILTQLVAEALPERRIVGTDFSPVMLEQARRRCAARPRVEFRVQDVYQPFPQAEEFAFGFGCDILHHLDDPSAAMSNLLRALRPGGRMLFLESNPRNPVLWLRVRNRPEEQRVFLNCETTLAEWARNAGFTDVKVSLLPFHLPNGPRMLEPFMNFLEDRVLHALPPLRHRAALFALSATRPA
ncbi:MAG: class I SAM-dependent methyltransferase [Planctomycetia bacterium]|nr:class I SAM-dependent methyltransferase [Planctomycetia bacterium]